MRRISHLNRTGTVRHNSTNRSFIYCLCMPLCKLFSPCKSVGSNGRNSWYNRSWLPTHSVKVKKKNRKLQHHDSRGVFLGYIRAQWRRAIPMKAMVFWCKKYSPRIMLTKKHSYSKIKTSKGFSWRFMFFTTQIQLLILSTNLFISLKLLLI